MRRISFYALAILIAVLAANAQDRSVSIAPYWTAPDVGALPYDQHGELVRRGRDLVTATYAQIGPDVADPRMRYAGNNLACTSCHLQAGTKKFGFLCSELLANSQNIPRVPVRKPA